MVRAWLGCATALAMVIAGGCSDSDDGTGDPDGGTVSSGGNSDGGAAGASGAAGTPSGGASGGGTGGDAAGTGGAGSGGAGSGGTGSGGSGGGGVTGTGPSLEELPAMLVERICVEVVDCLGAATVAQYFGDDSCADRFTAGVEDGSFDAIVTAVEAGRVTYNSDEVAPCLASLEGLGCGFSTTRALSQDACATVFEGSIDLGDPCTVDEECLGEAFCAGNSCPGTCTALLGAGGNCDDDDQCQDGLSCGDDGTCFEPAALDEDCEGGVAPTCGDGLICAGDDTDTMTAGTCKSPDDVFVNGVGADCDFDTLALCEDGLSCVVSIDSVTMQPSFACEAGVGSGEPCKFGVPTQCPAGEYCDADITQQEVEGDCLPLPDVGEPCVDAPGAGIGCKAGLICDDADGNCHAVNRLGGECVSDDGCSSEHCDGGECVKPETCTL